MRKFLLLTGLTMTLIRCDEKNPVTPPPPGPFVNKIVASISVNSSAFFDYTIIASNTGYASSNDAMGNLIIDITGNFPMGTMAIKLTNITAPGTYTINNGGGQNVQGKFTIGSDVFTVPAPPPIKGKVTIESITQFKIKGTFFMTCTSATGSVELKSGSFEGEF